MSQKGSEMDKKLKVTTASELKIPKSTVTCDGKYITVSERYSYHIEKSRCDTHAKILGWVQHLSHKNWVTTKILGDFVSIAQGENNLEEVYG